MKGNILEKSLAHSPIHHFSNVSRASNVPIENKKNELDKGELNSTITPQSRRTMMSLSFSSDLNTGGVLLLLEYLESR